MDGRPPSAVARLPGTHVTPPERAALAELEALGWVVSPQRVTAALSAP